MPGILTEVRAAVFTPVSEFAQRTLALKAFSHLHNLSIRFHLDRRTGGMTRAMERGTRALQQLTGLFLFNIAPTLFEVGFVCVYLGLLYPVKYVAVIFFGIAVVGLVLAIVTQPSSASLDVQSLIGEDLTEGLGDSDAAKRLRVVRFDEDTATLREFEVAEVGFDLATDGHQLLKLFFGLL